jgi:hypothetical protein
MSQLSLYIPIISESISEAYIKKMFLMNNIGKIKRVDFVKNKNKNRREAFIHFIEWFDTDEAKEIKKDILDSSSKTKFKYGPSSNYWPLLVNINANRKINNPKYETLSKEEILKTQKQVLNLDRSINKEANNKKVKK